MPLDVRRFVREEFEQVLTQRSKKAPAALLDALEVAFNLSAVQAFIARTPSVSLTPERQEKIHRAQLGRLARGLAHFIASATTSTAIAADDVRRGYSIWKETSTYRDVAGRYHDRAATVTQREAHVAAL